jgi:hypothetical protein
LPVLGGISGATSTTLNIDASDYGVRAMTRLVTW